MYNIRAKASHFPEIIELERSPDALAKKIERIKALNAGDNEFMVTFARKTNARHLWIKVPDLAKTHEEHDDIYKRMLDLEKEGSIAKTLGDIAPDYNINLSRALVDYLIIAGGAAAAANFLLTNSAALAAAELDTPITLILLQSADSEDNSTLDYLAEILEGAGPDLQLLIQTFF